ncbi:DMT family transporter [Jejubacter calystegiae]|uniref:DMT family transporter n=1 Tax=Jejubacter calystegiae TaxID=2579935 RepID=A0A4P8YN78_9ENTR|nr:DMT family transporter [Jejubacter calystegiae]QCT21378.1 DMT family transporter [Jejubacter calystegiae]
MENRRSGWINGLAGVVIFAGSLPATRAAVVDFDPLFLTGARAVIAAALAGALLVGMGEKRPERRDIIPLIVTAAGVVVGFPLLTALALQSISSARSIVFLGLLPFCTALFAVLRGGERPRSAFWLFSLAGAALVTGYALLNGGSGTLRGDGLMAAAVIVCGLGYAEGATLSRRLGGWQTICQALLIALPLMLPVMLLTLPDSVSHVSVPAWIGLGYVSAFSMLIGFIFWYRGLAQGGIAAVGQLQLLQPFIALGLASLLLHEQVNWGMVAVSLGAVLCVAGARRFAR